MGVLGMTERSNFLVVILLIITPTFIAGQFNTNNKLTREVNKLAQVVGIQRFFIENLLGGVSGYQKRSNVIVKMAAFDEEKNIGMVLEQMPDNVDVLVIDDASDDQTARIASTHGAMVIRHEKNMGQGIGDLTGFRLAFDMGYEYIVEMDADGQHNPKEIPLFIKTLQDNSELDIVVGSRVLGCQSGEVCNMRKTFLPVYTRIINWASGYDLTDAMCGFKAYRSASLLKVSHVLDEPLETEYIAAELYVRFGLAGLRVGEIPVYIKPREHGKSHKGTLRYGFAVAWVILRSWLNSK
jgi:glycosyltransferase involved in cell wall biosynthesis